MTERTTVWTLRARARTAGLALFLLFGVSTSCTKERAPKGAPTPARAPSAPSKVSCFEVLASNNSPSTRAAFAARHCQGGGVTWAALLGALLRRRGQVEPLLSPTPDFTGDVSTLNRKTRFAIDDEGSAALLCTDDPQLIAEMRREYERLNADAGQLRSAMSEATALELECLEADGSVPKLPALSAPPERPAEQLVQEQAERERLRRLLEREPFWCFPPEDLEKRTGALRFSPDGRVTLLSITGKELGRGKLNWPREDSGDTRVEVLIDLLPGAPHFGSTLLHLNVGDGGRIGFNYVLEQGTLRIDLIPGEACLHLGRVRGGQ